MQRLLRTSALIAVALLVPVVPLIVLGLSFEDRVTEWFRQDLSSAERFWLIAGVLSVDLLLPVPSSVVSTYGGAILGTAWATLASWLGMTVSAIVGFAAARWCGPALARRFSRPDDLERMRLLSERYGAAALMLTRALPILAEACVLLMGANRLSWRGFLPPVIVSNLAISLTYAAFGEFFRSVDALPFAILASAVIPLAFAFFVRRRLPTVSAE